MIIRLVGEGPKLITLHEVVTRSLSETGLKDGVEVKTGNDAAYKLELSITENPALCIEESSIDFKDMIFQGEIPEYEEIKSMFVSILGDSDDHEHGESGCGTGGCGTCSTGGCS